MSEFAKVPMRSVGPIKINAHDSFEVSVPLATYESPLWPSVGRGAKLSRLCGGINVSLLKDCMTRSVVFTADSAATLHPIADELQNDLAGLNKEIAKTSRYAQLANVYTRIVGRALYVRFSFQTGDASGHNMVTKASDHLMGYLQARFPALQYGSISGNVCVDKKVSAINGILGRGKHVIAEMVISREVCEKHLHTTPEALSELNQRKNWVGSIAAGSLMSANAHYANMLLGFYLATGQDAANIVEGSQGITTIDVVPDGVYVSVNLPNIIVGSIGNGKGLDFVKENLQALGCDDARSPGENARRLAMITAATVFCGELSLLAAQTNPGELMRCHETMERRGSEA